MKTIYLLLLMLLPGIMLYAQEQTVSGVVTSAEDNASLPGVSILIKGTTEGTVTDINGDYSLSVSGPDAVLVFSSVGFTTEEFRVGGQTQINVSMTADIQSLQELVVIGYGTQEKENLTGSVAVVEGTEISTQPVFSASDALMGKMGGVTVLQNSGQPGTAADIRIRGIGTLNNSDPLVLIDGVPGSIAGVDTRNIESISVLKDAASASIYGSRAANGVILITTKRGESGKFKVSYSGYGGWQELTGYPDYVNGYDFMTNRNLASINMGQDPIYTQDQIDEWQANHQTDPDHYPNTDWIKETFSESGFQQHHHLTLSGGSDMVRVLGAFSFMDQKGNVPNYDYKRYHGRINTDIVVSEKLDFDLDFNIRRSIQSRPSAALEYITRQTYRIPPIYAARYSDGSWGPGSSGLNPVANAHEGGFNENQYNHFNGLVRATYKPISGMNLSLMYSPQYNDHFGKAFTKQYRVYNFDTKDLQHIYPNKNQLAVNNSRSLTQTVNAIASYEKFLGEHFIKGLVGYELITFRDDWFNAFRDNFVLDTYPQLGLGSEANMQNNGSASEWGLQSYFARINYDYKGKYLLEANVRIDGSSRFAKGNRYGTFPAFSAGWRVSEESFMSGVGFINELKLRASWGQLGNQNIGNYAHASTITSGLNYLFGETPQSGAAQVALGNKGISWEASETTNFGIDMGVLQNRLTVSAEYFVRNTKDILLRLPIPMSIGLTPPFQNAGQVKNSGWELALGWNDTKGDFSYGIQANFSDIKNEVTDLRGAGPIINGYRITREGDPIDAIYGYQTAGFFQTKEEADNALQQFGTLAPGDLKYVNQITVDTDDDGVPDEADDQINANDKVLIGDPFPRHTFGVNLFAEYKGFDLSVFIQGVGKRDVLLRQDAVWAFYNGGKMQEWHKDFWTPDNPDAAYPRLNAGTSHNNFQDADFWMYDASYVRLRNLTVGYSFPAQMMQNIFVDNLRVYFSGQNLLTLDDMPEGWDPETPNGAVGAVYPITSVFTFGVDLTF